jgi:hypothetical protein
MAIPKFEVKKKSFEREGRLITGRVNMHDNYLMNNLISTVYLI